MLGYTIGMAIDTELSWYGDKIVKNVNSGTIVALIKSGNLVKRTAKLLSPVDTGLLRSSIYQRLYKSRLTEEIYTKTEYANHVEFGTKTKRAQPYMRPALKDNIKNIENIFITEENKAIGK